MPKYAILGATGNCGLSILKVLSADPKAQINVLIRSRAKLERLFPALSSNKNIEVFEGNISDIPKLSACLSGTCAAFLTVATADNIPGVSIALDTAKNVVSALQALKEKDNPARSPRLVMLSSACVDKIFWDDAPRFLHKLMWNAHSNIYTDLVKAEEYLRSHEDWLDCVYACPGGLSHDEPKGHELSLNKQQTFMPWLDLAAGMVDMASEDGKWDGKRVGISLVGGRKAKIEWGAPMDCAKGLICHYFPFMAKYIY